MDFPRPSWKPVDLNLYVQKMPEIEALWIDRWQTTAIGRIPIVKSKLSWVDKWGFVRIRWGMLRMDYRIPPGLYGIGRPDSDSPILVTCNFKMTFDIVRKSIPHLNAWILVMDTNGINVWCAAGKGTFGTEELVSKIRAFDLHVLLKHNRLILPQLGGVGVSAHDVMNQTKFKVIYGPVYARDLPEFIENENEATDEMRRIRFTMRDRLALVPMEFIPAFKYAPAFLALTLIPVLIFRRPFVSSMMNELLGILTAIITGAVLFQMLLPWLPTRSFAVKGWVLGIITVAAYAIFRGLTGLAMVGHLLFLPPLTTYLALNFTGSSTYTSQSGVYQELKAALPVMIVSLVGGFIVKFF